MPQFEYNKDISFEFVVLTAEMEIMNVASRIYHTPKSEWQTGVNNYKAIVDALESLAWPYLENTVYPLKMEQLGRNAEALIKVHHEEKRDNPQAYVRRGRNYEMHVFLKMIEIQWRFIQNELKEQGYLRQTRAHAVDSRVGPGAKADQSVGGAVDQGELEAILHDVSSRPAAR